MAWNGRVQEHHMVALCRVVIQSEMLEKLTCTVAWAQAGFHGKNNAKISVVLTPDTIFEKQCNYMYD